MPTLYNTSPVWINKIKSEFAIKINKDIRKSGTLRSHYSDSNKSNLSSRLLAKILLHYIGAGGDTTKSSRACCGCAYKLAINASQTQTPRGRLCSLVPWGYAAGFTTTRFFHTSRPRKRWFYDQLPWQRRWGWCGNITGFDGKMVWEWRCGIPPKWNYGTLVSQTRRN